MQIAQLFKHWTYQFFAPGTLLRRKYEAFKSLLKHDARALELIAELEELFYGETLADRQRANYLAERLSETVSKMVQQLVAMNPTGYMELPEYFRKIEFYVRMSLMLEQPDVGPPYILSLEDAAKFPEFAGGKASHLGQASQVDGVPVPAGFVVTANAYNYFIDYNNLNEKIETVLRQMVVGNRDLLAQLTAEMQEMIMASEVPEEIARAIRFAVSEIITGDDLIAVRSSALAEDGMISFAGQYASELNVQPNEVIEAYKRVLAGKYCPRAVSYRISHGLTDSETAMGVLILPMVDADNAGVVYSQDPDSESQNVIGVYGVRGLGEQLVNGSVSPDKATLTRAEIPILDSLCSPESGGLPSEATLITLGQLAMKLEEVMGGPQDIEWAEDVTGQLYILQTRPLQQERDDVKSDLDVVDMTPFLGGLECASKGVGCGQVYYAETGEKIAQIPDGAIVVVPSLKPSLLTFINKMSGIISMTGSRACHFASVAREVGCPVLVGECELPPQGEIVTIDGFSGNIFLGRVSSLLSRSSQVQQLPKRHLEQYASVIPLTVKLNLLDPRADTFSPEGCRSMHDMVRFCHEKAVGEMFSIVDKRGRGMRGAKRLQTHLPLVMYLLDLGGGIFNIASKKQIITPEDIKSRPMWALWYGLSDSRVQWADHMTHMDWEEFDKFAAGVFSFDSKLLASYGLISQDYLHLMIRFGYHFSVIDTVCAPDTSSNYINFRFKGGGTGFNQRLLRLKFIQQVLEGYGFETTTRGDMIDARCSKMSENMIRRLLMRLGYLLAVTRLMDMHMSSYEQVVSNVEQFMLDAEKRDVGI